MHQYQWSYYKENASIVNYLYPKWTANFWYWCRWFSFPTAYLIWTLLLTGIYILLLERVFKYAKTDLVFISVWVCALISIKFFCMDGGNLVPIIALLLLSPAGCLLGACFKCWCLAFIPIHFLLEITSDRFTGATPFYNSLRRYSLFRNAVWYYAKIFKPRTIAIIFLFLFWGFSKW